MILPRPVVIEGSLAEVDLGLDGGSRRWIGRNCDRVLHNAASLTFHVAPDGEPYLSNVEGTQRLLELCRDMGIRQFHHVSTAYVCGLRGDRCRESELDVGQAFGNDYERSKVQAETMIRRAKYLDRATIFRPAIIVGDSQSGYTSTFHGFYALLKLAHTLARWIARGSTSAEALIAAFELSGDERKNFVPVDWVSAVMTHVLGRPEHHGKTYHLVARKPLLLCRMAHVIQEAVEAYSTLADESDATRCDGAWFQQAFKDQLEIYRPYWRDDPEFDYSNTAAAAPHLPCPAMDGATAMRLAKYAIETNFGKRRRRLLKPEFDVQQHLQRFSRPAEGAAGPGQRPRLPGTSGGRPRRRPMEAVAQQRQSHGRPTRHRPAVQRHVSPEHEDLPPAAGPPSLGPRRRRGRTGGHRGQRHGAPSAGVRAGSGGCRRGWGSVPWSCRYRWRPLRNTCSRMTGPVIR